MKHVGQVIRRGWVLVAVGIALAGRADATDVSGLISADTTWNLAGSPYVVTGAVVVASDATLTIEPGVSVESRSTAPIRVNGTLSAVGSSNQPIVFTRAAGSLGAPAIQLDGISPSNMSATGLFQFCQFSHLTNGNSSVSGLYAVVHIADCQFMNMRTGLTYDAVLVTESELMVHRSSFSKSWRTVNAAYSYGVIASNTASSMGDLLFCRDSHSAFPTQTWKIVGNQLGPCGDDTIDVGNFNTNAVPCLIEGNIVSNSADKAINCISAAAVVRNNLARYCRVGIDAVSQGPFTIENNTFLYCTNGLWAGSLLSSPTSRVSNTIFWNPNSTNIQIYIQTNLTVTFCALSGAGYVSGEGNFHNEDPMFIDLAGGNYRLASNSPCINVGTNQAWMTGGIDLDGSPRIQSAKVDYGAYESAWTATNSGPFLPPVLTNMMYVWQNSPWPGSPYDSWSNAAHTIQDAIDAAGPGVTIWVTNGVYSQGGRVGAGGGSISNRVCITNGVSVRSVNGPEDTVIVGAPDPVTGGHGSNATRGVYIQSGLLSGFTVTNGYTDVIYEGGIGGGVFFDGASTVELSVVVGNAAAIDGGGVGSSSVNPVGVIQNSMIAQNIADDDGGGAMWCIVRNSEISGNHAKDDGGGAGNSTLINCTVTGNRADEDGGGVDDSVILNSIVYHNDSPTVADVYQSICSNICSSTAVADPASITNDPILLSASHIATNSPCIGAGHAAFLDGTDVDGEAWNVGVPVMGCDQPLAPFGGTLSAHIRAASTNVSVGYVVDFAAAIRGEVTSNKWLLGSSLLTNRVYASHAFGETGLYSVVLWAFNAAYPSGIAATSQVSVTMPLPSYVNVASTNPVYPYTNWATAAQSIQDAVDAVAGVQGGVVVVTDGVYSVGQRVVPGQSLSNRVVITNSTTVMSVNGPDKTLIVGAPASFDGNGAVRGVYMSAGMLAGFTVTNGHTLNGVGTPSDSQGGGVSSQGGTISNCLITCCSAAPLGGGVLGGTLINCTISRNNAGFGGGAYGGVLYRCVIIGNQASGGGGIWNAFARNCLVVSNNASSWGGGVYNGYLLNCTIVGNAASYGSGVNSATGVNCIVWGNLGAPNIEGGGFVNSCSDPAPAGAGNFSADPLFAGTGDYRLLSNSPCIDMGTNDASLLSGLDLDGQTRVMNGYVDMGAYEFRGASIGSDADGDSLGNAQERELGANPLSVDSDADGASDAEEFVAGTGLTNAGSLFHVETIVASTNGVALQWQSVSGKTYTVQQSTNLHAPWNTLQSGIPATAPLNVYTAATTQTKGALRVKLE